MRTALGIYGFLLGMVALTVAPAFSTALPGSGANCASLSYQPLSGFADDPVMLYAEGEGAMANPKEEPNRARAYLEAKAYAKMQAVANLAQAARGTMIKYSAQAHDYLAEEKINQEISGIVSCVELINESTRKVGEDTIVQVRVQAPVPEEWIKPSVLASGSGLELAAKGLELPWEIEASVDSPERSGKFTSLIVDAQGLQVFRCMSPKILRPDGSEVWGTVQANLDFVTEHGIVAYARNLGQAFASGRAGCNPLVVRAKARGRSASKGDVVLSVADADLIVKENRTSGFLADYRVIFVVDAARL